MCSLLLLDADDSVRVCTYTHMPVRASVCVWAVKKPKNFFWKPFGDVVAANCLIPFIVVVVTAGCPCLKWLGLFFSSFFAKFFANLPCTSFVYLMLSLSHTRAAAVCWRSHALSRCVSCMMALSCFALSISLWYSLTSNLFLLSDFF